MFFFLIYRLSEQIVQVEFALQSVCCCSGMRRSTSKWWCNNQGAAGDQAANGGAPSNDEGLNRTGRDPPAAAAFSTHITCNIWLASNAVPGIRMTGLETCPDSTHTIFGYSSSPKSESSLALWTHGFQITVSGKLYFWILILRPDTTFVMMCSCGVFW